METIAGSAADFCKGHAMSSHVVTDVPDLVAFWTFGEQAGEPRQSQGAVHTHPLRECGDGPIRRVNGGPFSGYSAYLNGSQYFSISHSDASDLNIHGPDAQVSMMAWIKLETMTKGVTVAGKWFEGEGAGDNTGTRQYALLMSIGAYGGKDAVTPHVSAEGGVSLRNDGSQLPWNVDYAASQPGIAIGEWISVGFTYDGEYLTAYYNGAADPRDPAPEEDKRTDPYFTQEGPGYVAGEPSTFANRGMNPYYHGRGIYNPGAPDPRVNVARPADFTVGARYAVGSIFREAFTGLFGGLAVLARALSPSEMLAIHNAADLDSLNRLGPTTYANDAVAYSH
jgi:hypothetical protein